MSGAQTTLALQDKLTGPLMKMMKAMDSTVRVMEQMDAATNNLDQKSLANARKNITNASADFERLRSSMDNAGGSAQKAEEQQNKLNGAVEKLTSSTNAGSLESSLNNVGTSAGKAAEQQNKLNAAVNSSPSPAKTQGLAKAMDTAASSAEKATKGQDQFNKTLNAMKPPTILERIRNLFKNMGNETDTATTKQSKFNAVMQQLRPSSILERLRNIMKSAGDSADKAASQQDKFNQSVNSGLPGIKSLATGLLGVVGAYKAFGAAKNFLGNMFSQGIQFQALKQSSQSAFTTFLGDAKKAKAYMDDMYAFALKTPFAYPDLLSSSRNLIAFGIEAENTFPIMQAVGDAVASVGGSNADIADAADIFGMIQAQGRITGMEVNRLARFGVDSYKMLGEAAGVSAEEMKKQISSGAIGAGQAIDGLVKGMNKQFKGGMAGVKGTILGAFDSFKSSIRNAGDKMMESYIEPLTKGIGVVTDLIKKIPVYIGPAVAAFLPLIDMFNETFAGNRFDGIFAAVGASITLIAHILSRFGQTALWVAGIFADNWSWIAPILTVMGSMLAALVAMLAVQYTILGLIRLATLAWAAVQWLVNKAYFSNPIVWILLIIVGVIALVIYAMVAWSDQTAIAIGAIVGSLYWLGAVFYNVLIGIANFGIMVAEWFVNTWHQAVYIVQLGWIGLKLLTFMVLDAIGNYALAVAEWFINAWSQSIYNVQMSWIALNLLTRMVLDAIVNAGIKAAEWFANTWNDGVYDVQKAFYQMGTFVTSIASGVASASVGMVNAALSSISNLINSVASGINSLIGMINNIPGVNISTIGTVDLKLGGGVSDFAANIGKSLAAPVKAANVSLGKMNTAGAYANSVTMPTAPKSTNLGRLDSAGNYAKNITMPSAPQKASFDRLEYKNTTAAYGKGFATGAKASMKASEKLTGAVDKVTGLFSAKDQPGPPSADDFKIGDFDPTLGGATAPGGADKKAPGSGGKKAPGAAGKKGNNPTGGKLDSVGKIDDEINIADEDLKMLRELADIRSIQNFVTLTPQVSFSGDMTVREEADIDKIIRKIEKMLEEEISRSAKGVYP